MLLSACKTTEESPAPVAGPIDSEASKSTKALFHNLKAIAGEALLFGHQDDPAYGVTWKWEEGRSDVKDITGAYPAVMGFDLGRLEFGESRNLDKVPFSDMQQWMEEAFRDGRVITASWHAWNPVSGGDPWSQDRAVADMLPGGSHHDEYKRRLDLVAEFFGGLKTGLLSFVGIGSDVPVIFRPYHEHTGSWFWWGADHCTPEEFIALWRFTVEYLRDEKGVHNLLYAYSTDIVKDKEAYLARYPGDDYVDLLGIDDYHALKTDAGVRDMTKRLRMVVKMAESRGKLAALTETGFEGIPYANWWTSRLLRSIESDPLARRISYALVWRNAYREDYFGHYFAPYPGHLSEPDFIRFYEHPFVRFGDDLPALYR